MSNQDHCQEFSVLELKTKEQLFKQAFPNAKTPPKKELNALSKNYLIWEITHLKDVKKAYETDPIKTIRGER